MVAGLILDSFDLEATPFRPARVHAKEHFCPVLAFGSACTGVNFQIGVVAVGLAVQQRLDFLGRGQVNELPQPILGLGDDLGVTLGFAEFDQLGPVRLSFE